MAKRDPKETLDAARELAKQLGSNTSAVEAYLKVQEKVKEIQDGKKVKNSLFFRESKKSKKYAFCSDTVYYEKIIELIN